MLEVGNLNGLVVIIALIMFGPALLLLTTGFVLFTKEKKKAGKVFFILAGLYLLISLGTCGALLTGM